MYLTNSLEKLLEVITKRRQPSGIIDFFVKLDRENHEHRNPVVTLFENTPTFTVTLFRPLAHALWHFLNGLESVTRRNATCAFSADSTRRVTLFENILPPR